MKMEETRNKCKTHCANLQAKKKKEKQTKQNNYEFHKTKNISPKQQIQSTN
jgi:hypothetical protein